MYWLTFDGLSGAGKVTVPTMFVHSDDCVLPDNVRALAEAIPQAELVWDEGSQIEFYDQPAQVGFPIDAVARRFQAHLPAAAQAGQRGSS